MDFKLRYYENKLGLLWALLKPMTQIVIYSVAFSVIFESREPHYAYYLFSALIPWNMFLESTTGAIRLLSTKKYLYEYSDMTKLEIYLAVMLSNSIGLLLNLIMFFLLAIPIGLFPTIHFLWLLAIVPLFSCFCLFMSIVLSNLFLLFSDITQLWGVFTQFLFFISPIFYQADLYLERLPYMQYLNPLSAFIFLFRSSILYGTAPAVSELLYATIWTAMAGILAAVLLRKVAPRASEILT